MHLTHPDYMTLALKLAERGRFTVSPNPMVGCILVKNNRIIGEDYHHQAGGPHAEVLALEQAGNLAHGATAYVTLEPCCHHGKTPPCTEALIQAGIKKIYIACEDPNPLVAGKGMQALRQANIAVEVGLHATQAKRLNEIFFHYMQQQRPFVIAKWAMSLDGKTIAHPQDTRDISSNPSRHLSHLIRQQVDAILIGANTAIHDDPLLTVRLDQAQVKQPLRIILSSRGNLPMHLKLFDQTMPAKTIIATTHAADKNWCEDMRKKNVDVLVLPANKNAQVDLPSLLTELGKRQISSLLVEGGMTVHANFFAENLVNKIQVHIAPVIIAALEKKKVLSQLNFSQLDCDFHIVADYQEITHV